MPTEFLTFEPQQAYATTPSHASTQHSIPTFLDDADLERLRERRGEHKTRRVAIQLTTVRFLDTFLTEPTDVAPLRSDSYVTQP
jgi:Domain of unknown function (DUF4158)